MSNSFEIAAVTATLRNLLAGVTIDLPDTKITTKSPRKARNEDETGNQINLFLYLTAPNAAWQKKQAPMQIYSVQPELPPLALNLYYLVTAYGRNDDNILSHRLLASAISILHHHQDLTVEEITSALPGNNLYEQIDQVRITPHPLSTEDLSKIWNIFHVPYDISVAYQVSVILISSPPSEAVKLNQGNEKLSGSLTFPTAQAFISPILSALVLPNKQVYAQMGDILEIQGTSLSGDRLAVEFKALCLPETPIFRVSPFEASPTSLKVQIPGISAATAQWVPGFWTIAVEVAKAGKPKQITNELGFALAPRIQAVNPNPIIFNTEGEVTLTVRVRPSVRPEQHVSALLGDREFAALKRTAIADTVSFVVTNLLPGRYPLILRVDGVNSITNQVVTCENCADESSDQKVDGGLLHD